MARYRTYKNGITAHKYKDFYIIRGECKGHFAIWNADKTIFKDNILDYSECEWIIDKETCNPEDMEIIKLLYEKEIYQLSALMVELIKKKDNQGLDAKSKNLYKWVVKVRKRKVENREF